MPKDSPRNFRYRYDLDGLRGIAIGLVVIYHVFVGRVSGGVDVFLLLSGYFFLGSQLRYASKPNASLNPWWPIWRTLRRLVPSLVVVIGVTYILVRLFTPQLMHTAFTQQITATVLYYQNWELSRQNADYTAAAADTSPLQHMWSMSVQGQFYLMGIALALIFAAIMKLRPQQSSLRPVPFPTVNHIAGPILIVVTVASFAYASRHGLHGTPENYYSTWSRAWELTLGAVLAIYGSAWKIPARFYDLFTGLGLFMVVSTGALIAETTSYPGPLSLLPLGGAVLIILGGGGTISKAMASAKARWLGDVAYPLYLWHWPLLIVSTSYLGQQTPPWWLGIIIIVISLLLADITHRFIERPLRQHRKRPLEEDLPTHKAFSSLSTRAGAGRAIGGVLVGSCVTALLLIQPLWLRALNIADAEILNPKKYPGATTFLDDITPPGGVEIKPDPVVARSIQSPVAANWCFVPDSQPADFFFETRKDGKTPCIFGDTSSDTEVYLVGGSHAEQYSSALDRLGREMGFKLVPLLRQGCPIELGDDVTVSPECAEWGELVMDRIARADPAVVISNTTRPQNKYGHGPDAVPAGYKAFWDELSKRDIPFLGFRDNPWGFDKDGKPREFDECYVAKEDADGCGMRVEQVYRPYDPGAVVLSQYENMLSLDTAPWFCDADGDCPVVIGNTMVYRDMHHITNAFVDSAMPMIREALTPFLNGEKVQQEAPKISPEEAKAALKESPAAPTTGSPRGANPVPYPNTPENDPV